MNEAKEISAEKFVALDKSKITVLDIRENDELIVYPIAEALHVPFSAFTDKVDTIPKDKPVYVLCSTGSLSEQVAEILADRDYDVYNVAGGVKAIRALENSTTEQAPKVTANEPIFIDAKGLKCPGPIVKLGDTLRAAEDGTEVYIEATEDAFASDVAVWCDRTGNRLKSLNVEPDVIKATVVKASLAASAAASKGNEKTFVVFSGDLDKTIASFIMANGAAAMGRQVTMFFTFWGLNVLRRPEKVKVKKSFIGKMFGLMMPRGTKKLGLSRMNMGGAGAKMIRAVMKSNGISSLEELMQSAIDHGVRIVACQMSMDIMGITKTELIDGVELGGVATMLGSAEKSDLTYFI
jgi:peroxiredoxin family protein/rhodanese-related sulfurtransferase/TusA-related sulfurtransferase